MHLLYLTLDSPLPADNGMRQRTWMLLQCLDRLGCRLTLAALAGAEPESRRRLAEICEVLDSPRVAIPSALGARLAALPTPLPAAAWRYRSVALRRRLRRLLAERRFDAIVADTVFAAINLPETDLPLIINHPDVEHCIFARYAACERHPLRRAYAALEARKLRRWESRALRRSRLGLVCSQEDARLLARLGAPESRLAVIPNAVDTDFWQPSPSAPEPNCIAFAGALDWYPNRDAVNFFAEAILPRLLARVPGLKLLVVGRRPPAEFVRRFQHLAAIEFSGSVADVRPWLARAAVFIAPLRMGSGTRLKLLQAASLAMPMVSTHLGAEGLGFIPEKEILLADDPAGFAGAIARLLADAGLRRRLAEAARRRVVAQYGYGVCRDALSSALAALLPRVACQPAGLFAGAPVPLEKVRA